MCYECQGIDRTISHYRQLEKFTTDRRTLDSIGILITRLEAAKAARHPETAPATEQPTPGSFFRRRTEKRSAKDDE